MQQYQIFYTVLYYILGRTKAQTKELDNHRIWTIDCLKKFAKTVLNI